jgi:hypothetical protein
MIDLSTTLASALGRPVTKPGLLVQIGFSTVRRWSSRGNTAWNGHIWQEKALDLPGLEVDLLTVSGSVSIDNRDGEIGLLALSEGIFGRPISLWAYDAGALDTVDVLLLCDAVGWEAEYETAAVTIQLRDPGDLVSSPRARVMPEFGFNTLMPSGTVVNINDVEWTLERPEA